MSKNNVDFLTLNEPNITDFAKARNKLLNRSNAEWVFFVDSDEKITSELMSEVKKITDKGPSLADGYVVRRKIYFLGKYIGKDKVLRLAKRGSSRWVRPVHEVWDVKTRVRPLQNYLVHNTASNLYDYIEKINKYAKLHAEANKEEGKKSNLFKILFYPNLKFYQSMIMGRGTVFSIMQSFHSFLAWSELWLSQRN